MRALTLAGLFLFSLPAAAHPVQCGEIKCNPSTPTFEKYQVANRFTGNPAVVNYSSHPRAKRFRTVLTAGAAKGPNFAGHYTVVTWGCGVACQELAIVDAISGKVYFPVNLRFNAYHVVHEDPLPEPFQFQLDSSLLVAVGSPNESEKQGVFFYRWDGKTLRLVHGENREWK